MVFLYSPASDSANFFKVLEALIGLVGLVITAIFQWLTNLSDISRRTREIDYASKRVELWKKLLDIQPFLQQRESVKASLRAFVQSDSISIKDHFARSYDLSFERRHFYHVNRLRRWLLLYQPLSNWSWLLRALFYLFVLFFCEVLFDLLFGISQLSDREWEAGLLTVLLCACIVLRVMCLTNDERNYQWESMWKEYQKFSEEVTPDSIEGSSTSAISSRLHVALGLAARVNAFERRITIATVAELIGDSSTQRIESAISGNEVLSFSDLDKVCELVGIHRDWLLSGDLHAFYQKPRYQSVTDFLHAIGKAAVRDVNGDLCDRMIFVLGDGDLAQVAIFGHMRREPYRLYPLLLGNLGDWDMMLVCAITAIGGPVSKLVQNANLRYGVILDSSEFRKLVDGRLHPGVLLELSITRSPWNEDVWDLNWEDADTECYTTGYREARSVIVKMLKGSEIRSNDDLAHHVEERLRRNGLRKISPVSDRLTSD